MEQKNLEQQKRCMQFHNEALEKGTDMWSVGGVLAGALLNRAIAGAEFDKPPQH